MEKLQKNGKIQRKGPLVLVIMDGMGIGMKDESDAFFQARTPFLDMLCGKWMNRIIKAHGIAVGLPSDEDMGNSEVGHNALGAGRVFDQGAKLVSAAIESGKIFTTATWKELLAKPLKEGKRLHLMGLLSDGNVHSHMTHLLSIIERCASEGVKNLKAHVLLDGRDVPETSALVYIDQLEETLKKLRGRGLNYSIASGGGRMVTTMDRYEADWSIVKRGWEAHVLGAARPFRSAREAVETFRKEKSGVTDQYLPSFTVVDDKGPVGTVEDGDSVIFFNFRGDRAIEMTKAFEQDGFTHFDRVRRPDVIYAGMMQYDGDLNIPKKYLVYPPDIDRTVSEYLAGSGVRQYAISETQKFGHVTYFWNGNRTEKFNDQLETYFEVPSDRIEFNLKPWMKAVEITDKVIETIKNGGYEFIRLNYPNGDMVGHTGDFQAGIIAAETVDLCLARLVRAVEQAGGIAVITADHGNLDEMYEHDKKTGKIVYEKETGLPKNKTSHTTNPVPFIIFDPGFQNEYRLSSVNDPGLANVAATLLILLGFNPPEGYLPPIIELV